MKKLLVLGLLFSVGYTMASKEVSCVCNDKQHISPSCGICGSDTGTMEQSDDGAVCYCENNLKQKEVTCAETCKLHGGWSGEFE
jgi:hypothetical protein